MIATLTCLPLVCGVPAAAATATPTWVQDAAPAPVFFRAESEGEDGRYSIFFDGDPGFVRSFEGIVLALPREGRKLDSYTVGSVSFLEMDGEYGGAYVRVTFADGFEPDEDEEFMVQLGVSDPNPQFEGLAFGLAAHGIALMDREGEELLGSSDMGDEGAYFDHVALMRLRDQLRSSGEELRELMEDQPVPGGRFKGRTMFGSMEKASLLDTRYFLEHVQRGPLPYMGQSWMLAEVYATWVMAGAPGAPEMNDTGEAEGTFGTGLRLADPEEDGFPRVGSLSRAVYGAAVDVLGSGARILSIEGESLYGAKPGAAAAALAAIAPGEAVTVTVHALSNVQLELELYSLAMPEEPHWEAPGGADFSPKLFPIRREDSWGFIDASGDEVIEPTYSDVYGHLLGHTFVGGLQAVEVDGRWGYINLAGAMVIPPKWPSVDPFFGALAAVMDPEDPTAMTFGARYGYIDRSGRQVIAPKYVPSIQAPGFYGDRCGVRIDGKEGFIDRKGRLVIPAKFHGIGRFKGGVAAAQLEKDGPYGYIDPGGAWAIEPSYESAGEFHGGQAIVKLNGKHVAIDLSGKALLQYELRPYTAFDPLKADDDRLCGWSEERQRYGFMDSAGKTVIAPKYTKAQPKFYGGLAAVTEEPPVDGEAGGWKFIDQSGKVVIEGPFEETAWFTEGACWVKLKGRWGLIDTSGAWLAEPNIGERPRPLDSGLASLRLHDSLRKSFVPQYVYVYLDRSGELVWSRFQR